MPRQPRMHEEGAFYHVMARGNRKQRVFSSTDDYAMYLGLMRKYSKRYLVEAHGYALMPNHVHMLLRVGVPPLAKFMQGLQQTYTQYFNKAYQQAGHVFQGRYKCIYVDRDEYLLELIKYIHLNPVKDGLVDNPAKYRWSSHKIYFNSHGSAWLKTYFIKQLLAGYDGTMIDDYRLLPRAVPEQEVLDGEANKKLPSAPRVKYKMELPELADKLSAALHISANLFTGSGRTQETALAKRMFSYVACRRMGYRLQEVADFMGCSMVNISKSLKWIEEEGVRLKLVDNNLLNSIFE